LNKWTSVKSKITSSKMKFEDLQRSCISYEDDRRKNSEISRQKLVRMNIKNTIII
jgi:hypothetical protein